MYSQKSDAELCNLLRQGDQAAYLEIYDRYKVLLQHHAHKKLDDPAEVEDILQELFIHVWERRCDIPMVTNLIGYLYTALRNRILNHYARKKRHADYLRSLATFINNGSYSTEDTIQEREMAVLIQQEIDALPPKMREVFLLHRSGELTYKQIADKLGTSDHTVATQIKKSLRILRMRLGTLRFFLIFFF